MAASALPKRKRSGSNGRRFLGVYRTQSGRKWYAVVHVDVSRHLGRFDDPAEAAVFRDRATRFYQRYRRALNFPERDLTPASVEELRQAYITRFGRTPDGDRRARRSMFGGVRRTANGRFAALVDLPERRRVQVGLWATEQKAAIARDRAALYFGLGVELNFPKRSRGLGPAAPATLRLEARRAANGSEGKSAFVGVHRSHAKTGGWDAGLRVDGVTHSLGRFETAEQAALWRERAVAYYAPTGSEALRNFPRRRVQPASLAQLRREYVGWRKRAQKRGKIRFVVAEYAGVRARDDGFASALNVRGRTVHAGWWRTEREAAIARDRAVLHFGLKAELNLPKASRALGPASPDELRIQAQSKSRRRRGESPFVGVRERGSGWIATLSKGHTMHRLGLFETAREAALWRERAVAYYGASPQSLRNFPRMKVKPASIAELRGEYRRLRKEQTSSRYVGVHHSGIPNIARPWTASCGEFALGTWETEEDAAQARDRFTLFRGGPNTELNFPERAHRLAPADAETLWHEARMQVKANKTSRFRGVGWDGARRLWTSRIRYRNRVYHLGRFDNEVDAARAHDRKALRLHGERARLNFHPKTGEELSGRRVDPTRATRRSA